MTVVLVHGVPETARIWDPLVAALARDDVVALALPGFGSPLPDGFEPTKERYAAWLADQLNRFDQVDLVGHDWGALLVSRVLANQPTNVRTWAIDTGDLNDEFQWHATAKIWQTPGEGEQFMERWLTSSAADRARGLEQMGAPPDAAQWMGEDIDETMGHAILGLYRSATQIGPEWGPGIDRWEARGLIIGSMKDPFRSPRYTTMLADRTGAEVLELPDAGHWWMVDSPATVAPALVTHWSAA